MRPCIWWMLMVRKLWSYHWYILYRCISKTMELNHMFIGKWFVLYYVLSPKHCNQTIMCKGSRILHFADVFLCLCAGNAGNVSPRRRLQRKPLVGDPGMHHGTCVTHVSWCMSGSLTRTGGENVPGIPGACAPTFLRIWQEARLTTHTCKYNSHNTYTHLMARLFSYNTN